MKSFLSFVIIALVLPAQSAIVAAQSTDRLEPKVIPQGVRDGSLWVCVSNVSTESIWLRVEGQPSELVRQINGGYHYEPVVQPRDGLRVNVDFGLASVDDDNVHRAGIHGGCIIETWEIPSGMTVTFSIPEQSIHGPSLLRVPYRCSPSAPDFQYAEVYLDVSSQAP